MEGAQSSCANAYRLIALSDSASADDGFFSPWALLHTGWALWCEA